MHAGNKNHRLCNILHMEYDNVGRYEFRMLLWLQPFWLYRLGSVPSRDRSVYFVRFHNLHFRHSLLSLHRHGLNVEKSGSQCWIGRAKRFCWRNCEDQFRPRWVQGNERVLHLPDRFHRGWRGLTLALWRGSLLPHHLYRKLAQDEPKLPLVPQSCHD